MSTRRHGQDARFLTLEQLAAFAAEPISLTKWHALLDGIEAEAVWKSDTKLLRIVADARFDGPGDLLSAAELFAGLSRVSARDGDAAVEAVGNTTTGKLDAARALEERRRLAMSALVLATLAGFLVTPIKERAR